MSQFVLIEPADGSRTAPLHCFCWPLEDGAEELPAALLPITWDQLPVVSPDRSVPRAVTFAWEFSGDATDSVRYDLLLATDAEFRNSRCFADIAAPRVDVFHLELDTRYYWKVTANSGGAPLATSPTWTVTTHAATPRWIHVPGITNVRDLGGWPVNGGVVRQGMIYRTSEMNIHLNITEEGRRVLLHELGIRCDLDLREEEVAKPALEKEGVRWVNFPVRPYKDICADTPLGKEAYRQIFSFLANPDHYPLLFHCWGGADRGGTLAFLLGALLGMNLEHLTQDYELTSLSVWGPRSRHSEEFTGLLACLREYGDDPEDINAQVTGYLASIGVTREEMEAIRAHLVSPSAVIAHDNYR